MFTTVTSIHFPLLLSFLMAGQDVTIEPGFCLSNMRAARLRTLVTLTLGRRGVGVAKLVYVEHHEPIVDLNHTMMLFPMTISTVDGPECLVTVLALEATTTVGSLLVSAQGLLVIKGLPADVALVLAPVDPLLVLTNSVDKHRLIITLTTSMLDWRCVLALDLMTA